MFDRNTHSMRRPRSGTHLIQRGEIWYYRRGVPKDVHAAFGCTEVVKSLDTQVKSKPIVLKNIATLSSSNGFVGRETRPIPRRGALLSHRKS